jgi:6-phosphogluconolactonase
VVSEAGTSSASSYRLTDEGLTPVSPAVGNTQRAACWLVVTNNGKTAYTANAQSSSISSYAVAPDGALQLIDAVAGTTPAMTNPIDLALSRNSSWLYSLATGTISIFRTSPQGKLTSVGVVTGLPPTTAGLAAR